MNKFLVYAAAFALLGGCAKCDKNSSAAPKTAAPADTLKFAGAKFKAEYLGTPITLEFDAKENKYSGKAVNHYFGSYTVAGNKINFGVPASTMMMGPPASMEAEARYLKLLAGIETFSFAPSGNGNLLLEGGGLGMVFYKE